ncbi:hypothetical protein JHK82_042849 [Glycine max]|uniref:Replication protein A 70 kDa DNA-binding subunit B/D first OB fold domain-containing protein n=1 Tax=Glycine max TaxID=3847 RepID=K7MCD9_SOYBN|nr:hypothetical protein JHK82_042849 [Glycine max]
MARAPDKIKSIDGSKETLKLAVRITNLWFIGIPSKSEQVEMVIVDSDGDEIHVVCKQDQLKSWKANLKESSTYVMHNFKVLKNDGQFRVCNHPYKLAFTGVTIVRQSDLDSLPFRKFKFDDFSNVIAGDFQTGLLVDIIGVVDEVVDQVLSCTLWENYCLQFLAYLNDFEDARPIVILLTHARIKEGQGFLIQELRSNQFWRLLAKPVHSFQDRVNYHRRMHFFQGLKQKAFAKLMPFQSMVLKRDDLHLGFTCYV